MQDITKIDVNVPTKPTMVLDINSSYLKNDSYSYARNAIHATHFGDLGTLAQEQRLKLVVSCPYKIIGTVTLPNSKFLIFSTDNKNSEIGVFDEKLGIYTKVYNPKTFGFNTAHPPITGEAKKNFNQKTVVVFGNVYLPLRRIILEDLPALKDEETTLFFKQIKIPNIKVEKSTFGNLPDGSYAFAMAYVVDDIKFSDYYSITKREQIYSESGGKGFVLTVDNLDREFDKYQIVMISNINGKITAQIVGTYATRVNTVTITDFNQEDDKTISLETLVVKTTKWISAGIIAANSNYLILGDLVRRKEVSLQHLLQDVKGEYVVEQIELEQYEKNLDEVGFYRDEVYDFYLEGLYKTSEFTNKFHLFGPKAKKDDLSKIGGDDVFEYDTQFVDCLAPDKIMKYQVYNTAGKFIRKNNPFVCGRRFLGYGDLGFWQSTELYPDNEYLFGDNANTPIRYFKMPDESIVPRYEVINGKYYVNVLGVRFNNLPNLQEVDKDFIGYRITRSRTDKTVVARGIFTNVRGYTDTVTNTKVLYTNYGVNSLQADPFLSEKQTAYKKRKETNYKPLTTVYQDKLNFFSPHMYFNEKYILGPEVKIESIESGTIKGKFESVYGHPRHKILSDTAFWIASMVGVIEAALVIMGEQKLASTTELRLGVSGGTNNVSETGIEIKNIDDLMQLNLLTLTTHIVNSVRALDFVSLANIIPILVQAVALVASLGIKITYAALKGSMYANQLLESIQDILGFTEYEKQFNGIAKFTNSIAPTKGNIRRRTLYQPEYLSPDLLSIREFIYQNFQRETSALFELNKSIAVPTALDESLFTIGSAKIEKTPTKQVEKPISAYYGTSKVTKPAQYGPLGSSETIIMHNDILTGTSTPSLFGGDCVIGRFSVMKKMRFFRQDMATEFGNELPPNFPDGTEYNYTLYPNVAYPRYWADFTKYDYSQLLRKNVVNKTAFSRTTSSKHNLDGIKNDNGNLLRVDNAFFYLSHNTVMEFICEADYNINFRERGDNKHYSKTNTNLYELFKPQLAQFPEKFELNKSFYNLNTNEVFAEQIRDSFTPETAFPEQQPNSVIYSLRSFNLQNIDNWQYMLPVNFWNFGEGSFGKLSGIHKIEQDALAFTFSGSSPLLLPGKDVLQLDGTGRKITIGDNGLFVQDPTETLPTDTNHGHTNSRYAFKSTHLGRYYPSEDSGLVFNFSSIPQDITQEGIYFWAKKYMPLQIGEHFPTYDGVDNPISGCGYLMGFDPTYKIIYLTKRDFIPKLDVTYEDGKFKYNGAEVFLRDKKYFEDISWTLSYSPENRGWISFHDWHPDWIIQGDNKLYSVKDNQIWKHNSDYEGFCNVYGEDVPFEIELISASPMRQILRSLEIIVEGYKYKNKGRDRFHDFDAFFQRMIVSNSEQISPILDLIYATQDPEANLDWPKYKGNNMFEILYTKEEGKYRVNQFWDATKDRGEFTPADFHLMVTDASGYKKTINSKAIDSDKPEEERKKFRHEYHKVWFQKMKDDGIQLILKTFNFKKTISIK